MKGNSFLYETCLHISRFVNKPECGMQTKYTVCASSALITLNQTLGAYRDSPKEIVYTNEYMSVYVLSKLICVYITNDVNF